MTERKRMLHTIYMRKYTKRPIVHQKLKLMRAQKRQWRMWAFGILKSNMGGCIDCGYNVHPQALEFDHLPQFKKHKDVSQLVRFHTHSWGEVLEEISKCELVCANCHRVRTFERLVP